MSALDMAAAVKKGAPMMYVYDFDENSCMLVWSKCATAKAYTIQMRIVAEEDCGMPQWKTLSSTLSARRVRKNKLEPGTAYEFRVAPMVENKKVKSTFTLGTKQDKDVFVTGARVTQRGASCLLCLGLAEDARA